MGYELTFYYREQGDKLGDYKDEINSKKIKIGKPTEDIPLEYVAGKIISQLAKKSILLTDVEIYEYTKKKLNYKETDDGILIKNRKFKFDDGATLISNSNLDLNPEEDLQQKILNILASNPQLLSQIKSKPQSDLNNETPVANNVVKNGGNIVPPIQKAPMRYEIFDPEPLLSQAARKRGLKFKVGNEYPIYEERKPPDGMENMGLMYVTLDDDKNKQILSSMHFVTKAVTLQNGFQEDVTRTSSSADSRLSWSNVYQGDVPSIR